MSEVCIAVVVTTGPRLESIIPTLASFLALPFVNQATVSVQPAGREDMVLALRQVCALGGVVDKRVEVVVDVGTPGIAQNKHHGLLSLPDDCDWALVLDDDVVAYPPGMQRMWDERKGWEAVSGIIYLTDAQCLTARPGVAAPPGQGIMDRVMLVRREHLVNRGGFMPVTQTIDHPVTGEDLIASARLATHHVPVLVAVETVGASTWDPERGGPGMGRFTSALFKP